VKVTSTVFPGITSLRKLKSGTENPWAKSGLDRTNVTGRPLRSLISLLLKANFAAVRAIRSGGAAAASAAA